MPETNITEKTSDNQSAWFTVLRIALGITLILKAVLFIRDTAALKSMILQTGVEVFSQNSSVLVFLVTCLNLLGGLFIAVGLFTRTSSIVQIPILIAAFIVNIRAAERSSFELILSVIVLLLLILFAVKGSGSLSADEYFRSYYKAGSEEGNTKKFFK